MAELIKLGELEPGTIFKNGNTYAVKSEYRTEKGVCEAFIIGSGEMFWGGTGNPNALKVEPVDLGELIHKAKLLDHILLEAEEVYNEEIDLMDFGERVLNIL